MQEEQGIKLSPEAEQRAKFLRELPKATYPYGDNIIGLHGLSRQSLEFLITNGFLPTTGGMVSVEESETPEYSGYFFFFPRKSAFPDHPLNNNFYDGPKLFKEATTYAALNGAKQHVLQALGLNANDKRDLEIAGELATPNENEAGYEERIKGQEALISLMRGRGFSEEQIAASNKSFQDGFMRSFNELLRRGCDENLVKKIMKETATKKGFVVGVAKSALSLSRPESCDDPNALRIHCPQGFPIEHISALSPLDQEGRRFIDNL